MKSLKTLIKLAKSEVEEKQKSLAETVARQDAVIAQKTAFEVQLDEEGKAARKLPDMAANFGTFAKATLEKIERLNREIARLEKIIEEKREELRIAFAEQKRYEIALDLKIAEEKQKTERIGQIKMDEIAANSDRRKKNS